MRLRWILPSAAAVMALGVGGAAASHGTQIDPALVPVGLLASHNDVSSFAIAPFARTVRNHQADVFVQHIRLPSNGASIWHTHPGPSIVTVVRGTFGYQREVRGECVTTWYVAGTGFVDSGGDVHRAIAQAEGLDVYATFVTPTGTPRQTIPADPPEACS